MFKSFYGLSFNPFDKQLLRETDAFPSHDHKEMLSRLDYLKDIRGIGVFTARPGMGKSFQLRCFSSSLNPTLHQMEYLCLSTISVTEFYRQFCLLLGLEASNSKSSMFRAIQERVFYLYKEKRKPLILAIDEAQYLNSAILKDIKMIMNHGYDSLNCFTLILAGEPYLNNLLEKPVHEALKQRVTVHYNYEGLSPDEITEYVVHKLGVAGASRSLVDDGALSAVNGYCQGNPRLIDNLMTDALSLGSQLEKTVIDADVILAAVNAQALQ
jgi:type II secretory pathway predicted ATPase ExeA